ncbi:hypothetical protein PYCC9005_003672 [Savitreella phatthalungensis]
MNFLRRSARRLQQQAAEIVAANPTPSTSTPLALFTFPGDVDKIIVGSDKDYKEGSTSEVAFIATEEGAIFSGKTAADGYAAFRSKSPESSLFGPATVDVGPYEFLALRLRVHDNRKYFVNIQTDSYLQTDLYQHRLFLKTPGQWETLLLPFDDFTLTNNGQVQESQVAMDKYRLKTIGISVLDRLPGKFSLEIASCEAKGGNTSSESEWE